jgi:hypothetical protein
LKTFAEALTSGDDPVLSIAAPSQRFYRVQHALFSATPIVDESGTQSLAELGFVEVYIALLWECVVCVLKIGSVCVLMHHRACERSSVSLRLLDFLLPLTTDLSLMSDLCICICVCMHLCVCMCCVVCVCVWCG